MSDQPVEARIRFGESTGVTPLRMTLPDGNLIEIFPVLDGNGDPIPNQWAVIVREQGGKVLSNTVLEPIKQL